MSYLFTYMYNNNNSSVLMNLDIMHTRYYLYIDTRMNNEWYILLVKISPWKQWIISEININGLAHSGKCIRQFHSNQQYCLVTGILRMKPPEITLPIISFCILITSIRSNPRSTVFRDYVATNVKTGPKPVHLVTDYLPMTTLAGNLWHIF